MLKSIKEKYNTAPIQAKAGFWFLVCAFFTQALNVISTPIFTRIMSTAEYGKFSVFCSWYSIFIVLVVMNSHEDMFAQGIVKFEEERDIFTSSIMGLSTTLTLVWLAIYLIFQNQINSATGLSTLHMLCMFVIIWASPIFAIWGKGERVDYRYKKLVALTVAIMSTKIILGVILVLTQSDKATARIVSVTLPELVFFLGLFIVAMVKGKCFYSKKYWRYALGFCLPLIPHYLSQTILSSADRIMIERIVGSSEAGIYSLAYSISFVMLVLNTALMQTVEPWLFKRIKAGDVSGIKSVAYPAFILVAVANLFVMALAPEIVAIFAPGTYSEAIWVMPPIAMSVCFIFLYSFFATFEFYYEKTKWISLATVASAVVNVVLNLVFIKAFGYFAAGYTTLVCYMLFALLHYIFMRRVCKDFLEGATPFDGRVILFISLAFMALGFAILATYKCNIARYIFLGVCLVVLVVFRRKIGAAVKGLMTIKQENKKPQN